MSKKYLSKLKFNVNAGKCIPNSILGSSLSPFDINLMEFSKIVNEQTKEFLGYIVKVTVCIISKNNYIIKVGAIRTIDLLKIEISHFTHKDINQVLTLKLKDFPRKSLFEIIKMVKGTIFSMKNRKNLLV